MDDVAAFFDHLSLHIAEHGLQKEFGVLYMVNISRERFQQLQP